MIIPMREDPTMPMQMYPYMEALSMIGIPLYSTPLYLYFLVSTRNSTHQPGRSDVLHLFVTTVILTRPTSNPSLIVYPLDLL
jgi:hypothetical protein